MKTFLYTLLIILLSTLLSYAQNPPPPGGGSGGDPPIGGDAITITVNGNVLENNNYNPIQNRAVSLLIISPTTNDTTIFNTYTDEQGLYGFEQIPSLANDTIKVIVFDDCGFGINIHEEVVYNDTTLNFPFEICVPIVPVGSDPSWFNYYQNNTNFLFYFNAFSNDNRNYYHWDFGDGATSEQQYTSHLFDISLNESTVTLFTAFVHPFTLDTLGQFYLSETISLPDCQNHFIFTDNGLNNFTFEGFSTPEADTYSWDFGDGEVAVGQEVNHTYENGIGEVEVSLTSFITSPLGGCSAVSTQTIFIDTLSCENYFTYEQDGYFVTFDGFSTPEADSYVWDMGDGNTLEGQNIGYLFDPSQNEYTVTLTTTIVNSIGDTCVAISSQLITLDVNPMDCENHFTYLDNGQNTFTFVGYSDPEADSYEWTFDDGTSLYGQEITHSFDLNSSEETITLTTKYITQNDSCITTSTQTIPLFFIEASFYYKLDSLNQVPNTFFFYDTSVGVENERRWEFGDGDTSSLQNPIHTYAQDESYYACLTSSNEVDSNTFCNLITSSPYYSLGGLTSLNNIPMNSSVLSGDTAIAFIYMKHDNKYQLFKSVKYYEYGYFYFENILPTNYLIKTRLTKTSEHYGEYLPSYYGNKLKWTDANQLLISDSNQYNLDINLPILPEIEYGNGSISGYISNLDNCWDTEDFTKVTILLSDENNKRIRYTECNSNGEFSFTNLPMGEFLIEGDMINLYSQAVSLSLTNNNPQQNNIALNFVCQDPNGLNETENQAIKLGEIYPNPSINDCNIDIQLKETLTLDFSIISLLGDEIFSSNFTFPKGKHTLSIPIVLLPKGGYILSIRSLNTNFYKYKKFIK